MRVVITVIGGGSASWMRGLMTDLYLIKEISGGEIRLVDPDVEAVSIVAKMLEKFNEIQNKDYKISVFSDRRDALKSSDFVLTTFSPGSFEAFKNDLEIPIKYGVRLPVSMTVGIPGISAAIRTAPVMEEIILDMENLCPGAWLLNVTNPMSIITKVMHQTAKTVHPIGLCHEYHCFKDIAPQIFGISRPDGMDQLTYLYEYLPQNGLDITVAGINHFIFLTKAQLNGDNAIPLIHEYCLKNDYFEQSNYQAQATTSYNNRGEVKIALERQLGYLALAGDRHLVEFWPSLCNLKNGFGMKYNVSKTTIHERILGKIDNLNRMKRIATGEEENEWQKSGEELPEILKAIALDKVIRAIVNMPNEGQLTNVCHGDIVETFANIGRNGVTPIPSGELPGAVGSICRLQLDIQNMVAKAALTGDRKLLIEAASLDPVASSGIDFTEVPLLIEELLQANKKWLPRFFQ